MYDYLIDHALKNVWCAPRQDMQAIVQPARITPPGGAWNTVRVLWREYKLPEKGKRFYVYQIGQIHPMMIGLLDKYDSWVKLSDSCNDNKLIADVYNINGINMLRSQIWYRFTEDQNLILAVKDQPKLGLKLDSEALFLRLYTNAFYQMEGNIVPGNEIKVVGDVPLSNQAILDIQNQLAIYAAKPGRVYCYINGYMVNTINLVNTKPGDVVEFVYDSSIYKVVDFQIQDLQTFDSILDSKRKYLLHYAGPDSGEIDYHDDIDFFLYKKAADGSFKGIYFHRNAGDAVRMVTHRDYSITVPYLFAHAAAQPDWIEPEKLYIRMHVRQGGWDRPLVFEANRIKELYKLDDESIKQAFLGVNSLVPVWRADNLENSAYTEIMRSDSRMVTNELVEQAYGYNAISKLIGDTPSFVRLSSNQKVIDVPYGLQSYSTGYEYDANGFLISWHGHPSGNIYPARNVATKLIEMVANISDDTPDDVFGQMTQNLDPRLSYRAYTCNIFGGVPDYKWTDVTDSGQYAIVNNRLTWFIDPTKKLTMVRSDGKNLAYKLNQPMQHGVLKFTLTQRMLRNGITSVRVMEVPMGRLNLWLNKKALIEGLDYIVKFPEVVIFNKEFLINPLTQNQEITVRMMGFCKPDFSMDTPGEYGFVQYGLLSNNNRFDLRDDKVKSIVVDGALYHRSELKFAESDNGVSVPDARNGAPYLIQDMVVPLYGITESKTQELKDEAVVIDKQVSDYMTIKMPDPVLPGPGPIQNLYQVYSPFCSRILDDLRTGVLADPRLKEHYGYDLVMELCQPYEWLLAYDPTQDGNELDAKFVIIHPHQLFTVVDIDIYAYKFITKVVTVYMEGKVSLSHFLRLAEFA